MSARQRHRLAILGSTGSIGLSTLDVVRRNPERFQVVALSAHSRVEQMLAQCLQLRPAMVAMADQAAAARLRAALAERGAGEVRVEGGAAAITELAADPGSDVVMAAIVGAAGLLPTLAAARAGKRVLLANKEALVMSGALFMEEVRRHGAELLPIDSEHNAVFQCLPASFRHGLEKVGVTRIMLTASGGPFRELPAEQLARVTPEQACAHPNWRMGRKISVDSATLMNKGLELIEACWLFDAQADQVQVVLHPQSVVHSLVAYSDGSVLAQLGNPDMRTPIAHALAWPERVEAGVAPLDLPTLARLDFAEPDRERFPCLGLAEAACRTGGTAPAVLNAANEVAVAAFLEDRIAFTAIPRVVEETLARVAVGPANSLEGVLASDQEARARATGLLARVREARS
jgi:1-deoxy-D-xylulose-5-phosphate reductoisomerase